MSTTWRAVDIVSNMHPKIVDAIQEIDAAVFNGDTFEDAGNRDEILACIRRWLKELEDIERANTILTSRK